MIYDDSIYKDFCIGLRNKFSQEWPIDCNQTINFPQSGGDRRLDFFKKLLDSPMVHAGGSEIEIREIATYTLRGYSIQVRDI